MAEFKMLWLCLFLVSFVNATRQDASMEQEYFDRMHPHAKQNTEGPKEEFNQTFWINKAQNTLKEHLAREYPKQKAKNVILFIGDGMSLSTVAAARILKGQRQGKVGEDENLAWEKFPVTGLSHTYCVNAQVADSACSSTAYLGGVKGNDGTIGVSAAVPFEDCDAMTKEENFVKSIAHHAVEAGKSAGIVTMTRVTHASPSGAFAHTASRYWENDAMIDVSGKNSSLCKDIAYQLIMNEPGKSFKVILGGGISNFLSKTENGWRNDSLNLIEEWKKDKESRKTSYMYVQNRTELLNKETAGNDYLLGLFNDEHLDYNMLADNKTQPSLAEMTEAAINVLSKDDNGFFLFVEGGNIDRAHHLTQAHIALDETIEMSKAVEKALQMTKVEDTLIVVSSDHSHTMSIAGYPSRGNDILGAADIYQALDGLDYITLSYANGPGYRPEVVKDGKVVRVDRTQEQKFIDRDPEFEYPGTWPLESETHGGEDVGVYAIGPWQHLFTGSYEQNTIPHMMAYALCVGDGSTVCKDSGSAHTVAPMFSILLASLTVFLLHMKSSFCL